MVMAFRGVLLLDFLLDLVTPLSDLCKWWHPWRWSESLSWLLVSRILILLAFVRKSNTPISVDFAF